MHFKIAMKYANFCVFDLVWRSARRRQLERLICGHDPRYVFSTHSIARLFYMIYSSCSAVSPRLRSTRNSVLTRSNVQTEDTVMRRQ
jgi:hypothetical protein